MFKLTSKITVESNREGNDKRYVIPNFVSNIEINSSWDSLGDTCTFELPKKVNWEGVERLVNDGFSDEPALFERGDKITVELGYDSENHQMFEGFISDIEPNSPVKIMCKDMSWYLSQIRLDKTYMLAINLVPPIIRTLGTYLTPLLVIVNANLKLRGLKSEFKFNLLNDEGVPALGNFAPMGAYTFPDKGEDTVLALLKSIKSKFDIYFWFRNNELIVDLGGRLKGNKDNVIRDAVILTEKIKDLAGLSKKAVWPFHFQRNVISQNLKYVSEKSRPLIIEISGTPSDTKNDSNLAQLASKIDLAEFAQVQFSNIQGNEGAAVKQVVNFSKMNKIQLLAIGKRIYNNYRYNGFEGNITTFGQYPTRHGDIAEFTDERHPERNGLYLIKAVNTTFGMGGYRQQLSIERNITNELI